MQFGHGIIKYQEELIQTLADIIKIPSKKAGPLPGMPFGKALDDALTAVLQAAESMGLKTRNLDGYCGWAEYGEGDEVAVVIGHLDVVPEGSGWSVPPFGALVKDGVIYGRGVSDNKGPVVAALYGLKLLKDSAVETKRRVRVIFGTDEESGMLDADYYIEHDELPVYGFTPDYMYPIARGECGMARVLFRSPGVDNGIKLYGGDAVNVVPDRAYMELCPERFGARFDKLGRAAERYDGLKITAEQQDGRLLFTAFGKSAHGSLPQTGKNAVAHLLRFADGQGLLEKERGIFAMINGRIGLDCAGEGLGIARSDAVSHPLSCNLGILNRDSDDYFKLDIRYPITADPEQIFTTLRAAAEPYGVAVEIEKHSDSYYVEDDAKIIALLSGTYQEMTGKAAELLTIRGGTYARRFKNRIVCFGGAGKGAHQPDEQAGIDEYMRHAQITAQAMYRMATAE